ncbi:ATP-dependent DNA helicase [Desulfococcus sp.]|uniref:ATP-dependent DNA helicase n=1 Tax=Desulfococcus sp. TaxID=2025834 RepID=UPI00359404DC
MFNPYTDNFTDVAYIFAHAGSREVEGRRVYAVAAAANRPGGEKSVFTSLIAYPGLTAREHAASGITSNMMADAPGPAVVSRRLRAFLGDKPFFLALDIHGVMDELMALSGIGRAVDLGFSAEFFFPHLSAAGLKTLWEHVASRERDRISFTLEEGIALSVDLARTIASQCMSDAHTGYAPALRHFLKKSDTLFGDLWRHLHRNFQACFGGRFTPSRASDTAGWRLFLEKADKEERKSGKGYPFPIIPAEHLDGIYRALAASGRGFRYRAEQAAYAGHVASAFNDAAVLTIEAGTGTGKTLGYLLPAMEYLRLNPGERIVVSTYTKSLQEQIFHNEVAFIRQSLPAYHDIRIVLLKGKSSYICIEKLDSLYDEALVGERLLAWLYCLITAFSFRRADIGTTGEAVRRCFDADHSFSRMLKEISAGSGCPPGHTRCPAQVVTAQALAADLVITNHHKLALLDRDPLLAGCFNNYIIDEANHFEPAVRNAFAQIVHSRDIKAVLDDLESRIHDLFEKGSGGCEASLVRNMADFTSLREAAEGLRSALIAADPGSLQGTVHTLPATHPAVAGGDLRSRIETLSAAIDAAARNLDWLKDDDACRRLSLQRRTRKRLENQLERLVEGAGTLKAIREAVVSENNITVYRIFRKHWSLAAQMVQVGGLIRERIHDRKRCVVYTAATICHRGGFKNFQEIAGMTSAHEGENAVSPREFRFVRIPSPYPEGAMEIIVPPEAVSGKYDNKAAWIDAVARALPCFVRENGGRTLVLFSSYQDLDRILEKAGAALDDPRFPLLVQRPGMATAGLCDEFRAVKESVLLGVDSFWYGVDFKGDTLTQVIITRIPYPPPNDPIQAARKHVMSAGDFWERYRYDTDIKMKQGIGRLIRSETDRGRVVILDSRYRPRRASVSGLVDTPERREKEDRAQPKKDPV